MPKVVTSPSQNTSESTSTSRGVTAAMSDMSPSRGEASTAITAGGDIVTVSSSVSEEEQSPQKARANLKGGHVDRLKSSDSFTPSSELSSPSEGEAPPESGDLNTSASTKLPPSGGKGKKSSAKKHQKKLKKGKKSTDKGKQSGRGNQNDNKESSSKKRLQFQRARSDSYTTSSDEEHISEMTKRVSCKAELQEAPRSVAVSLVEEGGMMDGEKLRLQLQYKIESRKPPFVFETPATDPIFHQV